MDGNAQKETCRAPAPGPDGFVPARPRVVLALAVLVLAGMAGFCLALYHSLTAVRPVDPADYPGAAPEGFIKYSKQGYEIAVVGESENTARYAGINVKRVILRTMALSGAICGIAGFIIVGGASHTISTSTAGGRGFTAIIVSWLSKFNTFVMILVSFFLVFMQKGAGQIASQFNLNENASDIITGIILFFILGCEFFINYKVGFRSGKKSGK